MSSNNDCDNQKLTLGEDFQYIDDEDEIDKNEISQSSKMLIRQNSIDNVSSKPLQRQNSLHELDVKALSEERSLSWDHYVEDFNSKEDEILQGLIEIRREISNESPSSSSSACLNRRTPVSKTSSKNTRCSSEISGFSVESAWNSNQSVSIETFHSHGIQRGNRVADSGGHTTSSGIRSISADESSYSTSRDSSYDPYEYDDEILEDYAAAAPSSAVTDDVLMLEVLCSERVSQMSKTYNDIEAVTRLLEEKEKDLELTARIGKELLSHNNKLEANVAALETELKTANERIDQITHELIKKTELIQVLTNDTDESGSEAGTPTALRCINVELMQRRVKLLEDENASLRREFTQLARETEHCEQHEQRLVEDITRQLASANCEVEGISDDLDRQREENRQQHELIVSLNAKLQDNESRLKKMTDEYNESSMLLTITKENQNSLAQELVEMKSRYAEVLALLQDVQEELKKQKKKGMPSIRGGLLSTYPSHPFGNLPPGDSLASELESSLYSELSLDSGISADRGSNCFKRVFDTVKCASSSANGPLLLSQTLQTSTTNSTGPRISARPLSKCNTVYTSITGPAISNNNHNNNNNNADSDGENVSYEDIIHYPLDPISGVPGVEGSTEIAEALKKLTPGDVSARRAALGNSQSCFNNNVNFISHNNNYGYGEYDGTFLPLGCRTPDSIMSTGSSSGYGGRNPWRLPDKLQIVKPMEGSATLYHWSQLATPTMSGLLEERPGVKTKGGRALEDIGLELYTLTDLEEDDDIINPGKSFQSSATVYTYTDSRVLHPDDHSTVTSVTHSLVGSKISTGATNSCQSTAPPTPRPLSRRNSCSTFSTNLGLAKWLNERGSQHSPMASALATPASEKSFTPTATPANSPTHGSPSTSRSPSPTPAPFNPLKLPGFLTSGAELLKRTFISGGAETVASPRRVRRGGPRLSRSDRKALSDIRIVEKIESIGLETIIAATTAITQPTLPGALYSRRALPSPMTQLTQFKTSRSFEITPAPPEVATAVRQSPARPPAPHRRKMASGAQVQRSDLGTVIASPQAEVAVASAQAHSAGGPLGTISSMLFGRKGGLL